MNPRKHPVWAAVFGASYMRHETMLNEERTQAAEQDADDAVSHLNRLDRDRREQAEARGRTPAQVKDDKGKETVEDILEMLHLYPHYDLQYRSTIGLLLDIVERFDPDVAERLRQGEDPGSLSERLEQENEEDEAGS